MYLPMLIRNKKSTREKNQNGQCGVTANASESNYVCINVALINQKDTFKPDVFSLSLQKKLTKIV